MTKLVRAPLILLLLVYAAPAAAGSDDEPLPPPPAPTREDAAPAPSPSSAPTVSSGAPAAPSPPAATAAPAAESVGEKAQEGADAPAPRFGRRGQWVFSGALDASATHTAYSASDAESTSYGLSPSIDWLVADGFSIGGVVSGSYATSTGYYNGASLETTTTTAWSLGARFGAVLRLGGALALWPRVGFTYGASRTTPTAAETRDLTDRGANIAASLPLVVDVAPHAFVGLGPNVTRTLSHVQEGYVRGTGNATILGASFLVGGWL